jgi:seryl-tRNA synthetase
MKPVNGLTWHDNGQASLSGPLLELAEALDRAIRLMAAGFGAEEEAHPAFIDAVELERVGYFSSFPQLMTFPVSLDADPSNLEPLRAEPAVDETGAVRLTRLAAVREVLTPAACYHLYVEHRGEDIPTVRYLTTRNTCFRREERYEPLRRQWSFQMREIVCLGDRSEVDAFLDRARRAVDDLALSLDVGVRWEPATDPFFQPLSNPRYLLQKVAPTKFEATYTDGLALASVNLHHDHFGTIFDITRDGEPVNTGCLAFGLERWLYAVTHRHGPDPSGWPDVLGVAP